MNMDIYEPQSKFFVQVSLREIDIIQIDIIQIDLIQILLILDMFL